MTTGTSAQPAASTAAAVRVMDVIAIQKTIPHRYPFLLVDKVEVIEESKKAIGTKCVTINEPFFQGHFPGHPIMPGVLIIEAMAQTCCALLLSKAELAGKIGYFLSIEEAKFREAVRPGAVLKMHVEVLRLGGRGGKFKGSAFVDGKLATEAEMSFVLVDK